MKVLFILNHAPDYREPFLRELGTYKYIELTVIAQPCEPEGLSPPKHRENYNYIEISSIYFFGLLWQPDLRRILRGSKWDIVCVSANLRHFSRLVLFITSPRYWKKWLWWGHIFGKNRSHALYFFRRLIIKKSAGCLVHGKFIATEIIEKYAGKAMSFNNTEIRKEDFCLGKFNHHPGLRMLFVGRFHSRKKLHLLVDLVRRRNDVQVRLVGPGMEKLSVPEEFLSQSRVELFGRTVGKSLRCHFEWADIVVNPGAVGLLAVNAAKHGKGIVIDSGSKHGPEFVLAKEANQPFIPFDDPDEVDQFVDRVKTNRSVLKTWGLALQEKAIEEYTIENMAKVHIDAFELVSSGRQIHS